MINALRAKAEAAGVSVNDLVSTTLAQALQAASMHIWVDADACPAVIKEILYRAA